MANFQDKSGAGDAASLNEQAWVPRDQVVGRGRTCVRLQALPQGRDILLRVSGGQEHVGAVAVARSTAEGAPEVELIDLAGHREGPLAEECAAAVAAAAGRTCVATVGIHVDQVTPEEILFIIENVRRGLALMTGDLKNRGQVLSPLAELMAGWALEAGQTALELFRRTGDLEFKHGREAVTEADRRIELVLRQRIAAAFPDDLIVGEEYGGPDGLSTGAASTQQRVWYLDPVDGTMNYALGLPEFCTSLALMKGEEILAGCIAQPISRDVFTAVRGGGAHLNGAPLAVSGRTELSEAIISTQLKKDTRFIRDPALLQALTTSPFKTRRMGAMALELAYVAGGFYDGLLGALTKPLALWDVAAGILLIEEAGGMVTNGQGEPFRPGDHELLACNRHIHGQLLARIM